MLFPAPLGPIIPKISPGLYGKAEIGYRPQSAEPFGNIFRFDDGKRFGSAIYLNSADPHLGPRCPAGFSIGCRFDPAEDREPCQKPLVRVGEKLMMPLGINITTRMSKAP